MKLVTISTDTIKLGQLLKAANMVSGGGEAKIRIQNGEITVNGEVETRRGKKIRPGDTVHIDGHVITVKKAS